MTGWRKRTIMEMAQEAEFELDCVSLKWHKRIKAFAKLVREDALAQPAPVQEPVGCLRCATPKKCAAWGCSPNTWPSENATPSQRTWVGLMDEEHYALADKAGCISADWVDYAKAIEAKLKQKNI